MLNSDLSDHFRETWALFDPDATTFMAVNLYSSFLLHLGEPLGWDPSYEFNYLKQEEYLSEVTIPSYNKNKDYQFMDVFEHQALLMIVKKEVADYVERFNSKLNKLKRIRTMISMGASERDNLSIGHSLESEPMHTRRGLIEASSRR